MAVIINPGSGPVDGGTLEVATANAQEWLDMIHADGMPEVEMAFIEQREDGRYHFLFTHPVTGKTADLEIHGLTAEQAKEFVFHPRVYWNGSSSGNPTIEDFKPEGWRYRIVFSPIPDKAEA